MSHNPDPLRGFSSLSGATEFDPALWLYAMMPQPVISCPISQSEKFAEALEQLNVFSCLGEDWDGYGGAAIGKQAIQHARSLLTTSLYSLATLPEITPTSNGTLVIEWQGNKGEAAVEIGNTRVSGVIKPQNSPTICIEGENTRVADYLPAFIAPLLGSERRQVAAITPVEYELAPNG